MRTIRNRAVAVAATALIASLALTACGPGDSADAAKNSGGAAASSSTPPAGQQTPTDNEQQTSQTPADRISGAGGNTGTTGNTGSGTSGGGGTTSKDTTPKGTSPGDPAKRIACTGDNAKVKVSQVSRPINHLLLTVTNTGGKNCDAYYAPALRFDDAQAPTQVNEDSQPQAVVTLAPGQSAYASVALGGDGAPNIPAEQLTVHFPGRDNQGSVGSSYGPITLPAGTKISDTTSVSYWQTDMADALMW
ncbi:DUF4232 domain-containing protein [Streptomyces sp. 35G-GA-8]|uniref:DUF4232 domain-containing protein n=1 Tax=Streptomyces sp. 35G-GA-8 TaxID=2939434 RepID=UPI00201F2E85|nr:DUF4232 domain-containing protein [Streptomyces sp. 35G-GA-8]MCL7376494.1 DUF4232 domain-containing protein [Streptomyces sp. 35G-GA-8]